MQSGEFEESHQAENNFQQMREEEEQEEENESELNNKEHEVTEKLSGVL